MRIVAIVISAAIGLALLASPIAAYAKTAKECRAEWQAKKADFQAKKITQKDYIKQCTGDAAAIKPAPAKQQTTKKSEPAKRTEPKSTSRTPAATPVEPKAARAPAPKAPYAMGAKQFGTEAQAKSRCGSGAVVWVNLDSKIYHFAGYRDYGGTKHGAYMCERDATDEGMRAAKNEKHP
jgi:hypothetical protein